MFAIKDTQAAERSAESDSAGLAAGRGAVDLS